MKKRDASRPVRIVPAETNQCRLSSPIRCRESSTFWLRLCQLMTSSIMPETKLPKMTITALTDKSSETSRDYTPSMVRIDRFSLKFWTAIE